MVSNARRRVPRHRPRPGRRARAIVQEGCLERPSRSFAPGARLALVLAAAVACAFAFAGTASADSKHFFWGTGQQSPDGTVADSTANDLIYHGGNAGPGAIGVEQKPAVYLVYWGQQWKDGFQTADTDGTLYSSKTLQAYVNSFFQNVGGSSWANIQTQYCNGVLVGVTNCIGGTGYVTNPKGQLKGTWTDPTPVPNDIVTLGLAENLADDPIAAEACARRRTSTTTRRRRTSSSRRRPRSRPASPSTAATTRRPRASTGSATRTGSSTPSSRGRTRTGPGIGTGGCGMHYVNATSDAFGNGIFDGWSIVTGHEYAEAVTDPDNIASWQDGWLDAQGSENGDKCAWLDTQNISLGGHQFAVQPLWSNEAFDATGNGCVVSR